MSPTDPLDSVTGGPYSIDDTLLRELCMTPLLIAIRVHYPFYSLRTVCSQASVFSLCNKLSILQLTDSVLTGLRAQARAVRSGAPSTRRRPSYGVSTHNPAQHLSSSCTYEDYQSTVELPTTDESWPDEVSLPRNQETREQTVQRTALNIIKKT
jgi:hypothetical protein